MDARPVADDYLTGQLVGSVPRIGGLPRLAGQRSWQVVLVGTPLLLMVLGRLSNPRPQARPRLPDRPLP